MPGRHRVVCCCVPKLSEPWRFGTSSRSRGIEARRRNCKKRKPPKAAYNMLREVIGSIACYSSPGMLGNGIDCGCIIWSDNSSVTPALLVCSLITPPAAISFTSVSPTPLADSESSRYDFGMTPCQTGLKCDWPKPDASKSQILRSMIEDASLDASTA